MSIPSDAAAPVRTLQDLRSSKYTDLRAEDLGERVKELLHEGTVRRIIVKNDTGNTVLEVPVVAGLVAAVIAPVLTAVGALAAIAGRWQIEVHRQTSPGAGNPDH